PDHDDPRELRVRLGLDARDPLRVRRRDRRPRHQRGHALPPPPQHRRADAARPRPRGRARRQRGRAPAVPLTLPDDPMTLRALLLAAALGLVACEAPQPEAPPAPADTAAVTPPEAATPVDLEGVDDLVGDWLVTEK